MKYIELFAGIGGFRRGLEQLGHECVGWVEWDKFARQSYMAIWPEARDEWNAKDITEVRSDDIPRADIWGFGFPCQDLSVAGRRLGFNGNRSSLFFTVMELLRGIQERDRPERLIAENTMGFFSSNNGWDFLAAQVAMAEVGHDTEYDVFNATDFGIPQNRDRVFIVGHLRGRSGRKVFPLRPSSELDMEGFKAKGEGRQPHRVTRSVRAAVQNNPILVVRRESQWHEQGSVNCIDANYAKGIDAHGQRTAVMYQRPRGNNAGGLHQIAPTVTANHYENNNHLVADDRIRKLTPREVWRLFGREDWEFDRARNAGVSDSQLYKQAGNSLVPQIVTAIAEHFED